MTLDTKREHHGYYMMRPEELRVLQTWERQDVKEYALYRARSHTSAARSTPLRVGPAAWLSAPLRAGSGAGTGTAAFSCSAMLMRQ